MDFGEFTNDMTRMLFYTFFTDEAMVFDDIETAKKIAKEIWKQGDFKPSIHEVIRKVCCEIYVDLDK